MTDSWASSIEELEEIRVMRATLTSGARVLLGTVALDELIASEALPKDLIYVAVLERSGATVLEMARELKDGGADAGERVREISKDVLRMHEKLAYVALMKGGHDEVEAGEVLKRLDEYDRKMIADLAQRKTVEDAAGRRFGAETLGQFRGDAPEPAGDAAGEARGGEGLDVPEVREG